MNGTFQSESSRSRSGFTLIEVVASLAILLLLVGGVYGVAHGALRLSTHSVDTRVQELRLTHFVGMMRAAFRDLPYRGRLVFGPTHHESTEFLAFQSVPGLFQWLSGDGTSGQYLLRMEGTTLILEEWTVSRAGHLRKSKTLPLLERVEFLRWRSFEMASRSWVSPQAGFRGKPPLVELTFQMEGDEGPRRHVFSVSRLNSSTL